jgi:hypothetical protein
MKIPSDAIIQEQKLTKYLLVFKPRNDKSNYLAQAGFNLNNWQELKIAIRKVTQENEAIEDLTDQYGTYYQVIGELKGVNHYKLRVITVWQQRKADNRFYFITLKPHRVNQE